MSREEIDHYAIMAVARWLREWRERTGTSQRRVAELAGIDQGRPTRGRGRRRSSDHGTGRSGRG